MKILLVLPAAEPYRIISPDQPVPRRRLLRFSLLPLLTVAGFTPPQHDVRIVDENTEALDLEAETDMVGISFMTALAPRAYEISAAFRRRGIPTVAGGYHPTLCPEEAESHFDAVVVGDAEQHWRQVLKDAAAGRLKPRYTQYRFGTLAGLPLPRRELIRAKRRHYGTVNAVQATRGCPHQCTYCSVAAFHLSCFRTRPVADVVDELRRLEGDFILVDDNLIADPAYARELFTALRPLKKRWVAQCSLRLADDPVLLKLAAEAGCCGVFLGIESAHDGNLAAVGKSVNRERPLHARIARIRRHGIGVIAGIMVGMDHDRVTVFQQTLSLLERLHIDAVQVNIFTPLPGTPLHRDYRRRGRIIDSDYRHYDFRHAVIEPVGMTAAQLKDGADWLYRQFYRLDRVLIRFARSFFTLGPAAAWLALQLNLTYRYDNRRENIFGQNPADPAPQRPTRQARPDRLAAGGRSGHASRSPVAWR